MNKILIGLSVLGRPKTTRKCLKALFSYTNRNTYELIVTDQDATPEVKEVLYEYRKEFDDLISNEFNNGIVFSHNKMISMRKPRQSYLKLDDDVLLVTSDWLDLINKALNYKDIGSALCLRPTFWYDAPGRKEFFYKDIICEERDNDFWLQISPKDAGVVGCCWALKGEILDQLGYFNEDLSCDDLDMPIRINQLGFKNCYVPNAVIFQPFDEENGHKRKWIAKALYNKNISKSAAYNTLYHNMRCLYLESRFGGWFNSDPGYIKGSDENWEFCKLAELPNKAGTYGLE